ncbi:preprotein translocase subunit YajC [Nocardia vermiculata]|uniref:Preprotein translocase subunit YajC n=1 Tax=Nocardia vermiculata TaxID=257274 RepID=A0A846XZA3_9NOCA|nr:preprotein translocase subunit YajC [Nocardia vermiculata]NKY51135.1 preprotein translocase subunit YajC [Nocardia vermiculata]
MANLLFPLLLVVLLVPMFLGVRRQKREAEKVTRMQEGVKAGDRVITTSGLYGTVVDLDDDTVDLEIAEDVVTTWLRAAIREVRPADDDAAEETTDSAPASGTTDSAAELAPAEATASVEESTEDTAARLHKD